MRKKWGFFVYLILSLPLLLFPGIVYAVSAEESFSTTFTVPEVANNGDQIDLAIKIKSEQEATDFEATVKYDSSILEFIGIARKEDWTGDNRVQTTGSNTLKFSSVGVMGESDVAVLRFRVKSSTKTVTTVSLEDIKLTLAGEEESNTVLTSSAIEKDITIKSDDNRLKSIRINNKAISGFSSTVYNYTMEVSSSVESVEIKATLNDEKTASFVDDFGNRSVDLDYGENIIEIKTKSESGKSVTYTVKVIRKDDRLVNNNLEGIIINGGKVKIDFNTDVLSYTVKTYKLETIEIEAQASDTQAVVKVDVPKKLIIGQNEAKITVTAVTGDEKEYTILIINRDVATDTHLKTLAVKGVSLTFDPDKYEYTLRYDKSYKNGITIYQTTVSEDVEVRIIGNESLQENDKIQVIVEALDGSGQSTYTIVLTKDTRINFFLILDIVVGIVLIILIAIQLRKRKKNQNKQKNVQNAEELEKTKEIKL